MLDRLSARPKRRAGRASRRGDDSIVRRDDARGAGRPGNAARGRPAAGAGGRRAVAELSPLTAEGLRGKVVLVDFWTYSCINCLRTLPYVKAWAEKYRDQGLVVIGVHAPEFAFERNIDNVKKATRDLGIDYPRRGRQQLRDLARLQQPVLAGALFRRCAGADPLPPLRRGRVREIRAGDPATAGGSRPRRRARR
ncbi:hypothetical protein ACU4GD_11550 [Cupriavidus basilensis]